MSYICLHQRLQIIIKVGRTCSLDYMEIYIFNNIFLAECALKLLGLGFRNYMESSSNMLDLVSRNHEETTNVLSIETPMIFFHVD